DIDVALNDKSIVVGGAQDNGVYYRDTNGDWRHRPWGDGTGTAADPSDPRIIYFSQQNGVDLYYDPAGNLRSGLARSVDGGAPFSFLTRTGLSGGSDWVTLIKLDPRPLTNAASDRTLFVSGYNTLFRSTTGGTGPWQRVNMPGGGPFTTAGFISALEFAPS